MMLWIIFAGLSVAALVGLSWPLWRSEARTAGRSAHDSAVYRDQLAEIEADLERGLIGEREAQAARLEVSRRLLAVADRDDRPHGPAGARGGRAPLPVLMGALAGIPVLSVVLYLAYGSPALPDRPHAARLATPDEKESIQALVAKVEARLRANPTDGRGWDVIAPVYLRSGRYRDAADAYGRAISLLGESTARLSGHAEALILANSGIVSETARKAYERALAQDPTLLKARFWLATAKEQDGRYGEAAEAWREMLAQGSEGARWKAVVAERLRVAEAKAGAKQPETAAAPDADRADGERGPSAEQMAAAQSMTAEERAAMINSMVEGLAARLKEDGRDLKGWLRLVRAYNVLGQRENARTALADARRNFGDDASALSALDSLAESLGLQGVP